MFQDKCISTLNMSDGIWSGQSLQSDGAPSQGKDPQALALQGSRSAMYQHPAVNGYNPQDSRGQGMPVSVKNITYVRHPLTISDLYHGYGGGAGGATLTPMPLPSPAAPLPMPPYPVYPDVKFKKLPFYDVLAELMKPSTMMPMQAGRMQEGTYVFHLTPQQATEIAMALNVVGAGNKLNYGIQVQLRFCLLETSCEQEDNFPPNVNVKVNNEMCLLPDPIPTNKPSPEIKRPPCPLNITSLVKPSPTIANQIHVTWAADFTRAYVLGVFKVRKLTSAELLQRLKNKGTKNPDYTRSLIKEKLSEDCDSEIETTSLQVSLMCPLGKMRMSYPCRPAACPHLQCFDASLFLQMNERKPTWLCPVCDRPVPYDSLVVDGYFQEVLASGRLPSECNKIQLHVDGSWSANAPPPRPHQSQHQPEPVITVSDLEEIPLEGTGDKSSAKRAAVGEEDTPKPAELLVDLTLDSEDEHEYGDKTDDATLTPPLEHQFEPVIMISDDLDVIPLEGTGDNSAKHAAVGEEGTPKPAELLVDLTLDSEDKHGYGDNTDDATLAPIPSSSPTAPLPPYPVHPDVKFKKLPLYDLLAELMKPSTMMPMQAGRVQEGTYEFHLTPQQATKISTGQDVVEAGNKLNYVVEVQLRFCLLETSCEQEDNFPPSVNVKVNNKMCPLPNPIPTNKPTPEPKRPPRPVNITSLVKLSPKVANQIHVTWAADFTQAYVLGVFMVKRSIFLTSAEVLQQMNNKGTKNPLEGTGDNSAKRVAVGDERTPKPAKLLVDLTLDSEDEMPFKMKVPQPKATPPESKSDDGSSTTNVKSYLNPLQRPVVLFVGVLCTGVLLALVYPDLMDYCLNLMECLTSTISNIYGLFLLRLVTFFGVESPGEL